MTKPRTEETTCKLALAAAAQTTSRLGTHAIENSTGETIAVGPMRDRSAGRLPPAASTQGSASVADSAIEVKPGVQSTNAIVKRVALCLKVELTGTELAALETAGGQASAVADFGSAATSTTQTNELLELIRSGRAIWLWGVVKAIRM